MSEKITYDHVIRPGRLPTESVERTRGRAPTRDAPVLMARCFNCKRAICRGDCFEGFTLAYIQKLQEEYDAKQNAGRRA